MFLLSILCNYTPNIYWSESELFVIDQSVMGCEHQAEKMSQ